VVKTALVNAPELKDAQRDKVHREWCSRRLRASAAFWRESARLTLGKLPSPGSALRGLPLGLGLMPPVARRDTELQPNCPCLFVGGDLRGEPAVVAAPFGRRTV
jgi:hypothetical protein